MRKKSTDELLVPLGNLKKNNFSKSANDFKKLDYLYVRDAMSVPTAFKVYGVVFVRLKKKTFSKLAKKWNIKKKMRPVFGNLTQMLFYVSFETARAQMFRHFFRLPLQIQGICHLFKKI